MPRVPLCSARDQSYVSNAEIRRTSDSLIRSCVQTGIDFAKNAGLEGFGCSNLVLDILDVFDEKFEIYDKRYERRCQPQTQFMHTEVILEIMWVYLGVV